MNEFENCNCYVCGERTYLPYSNKGQFGITTNVVICKNCGFSYLNPRWTKERYHHFYSKEYDTYYRPEVISKNYVYDSAIGIKNIIRRSDGIIDFKKPEINILDIGAGMGDSLIHLKTEINESASYFAIESSDHCISHLKQHNVNVIGNDVDSNWHSDYKEKFDVVIMRHVLEHFLNPSEVLQKARFTLKPEGILYIAVPNAKKPTKPLLSHFFRVVHVSYFSDLSLTNLFYISGMNIIKLQQGDAADQNEIFSFCNKTDFRRFLPDKKEWRLQKKIYDRYRRLELYYRIKNFIAKKIILRFK